MSKTKNEAADETKRDYAIEVSPSSVKAVELWAVELGTPDWLLQAARATKRWAEGRELLREEYEKALAEVGGMKLVSGTP